MQSITLDLQNNVLKMVIDTKIIASGKMYYAEKSNELYIESGRQGVYAYTIYKISDGKIQEEEVNSYDTSGKTAFVYNRPKTIQQIIDDLSGETAKTNTETLSAASATTAPQLTRYPEWCPPARAGPTCVLLKAATTSAPSVPLPASGAATAPAPWKISWRRQEILRSTE